MDDRGSADRSPVPTVYFARAVDGLDRAEVLARGQQVADEVRDHGLRLVDPVAMWTDPTDADPESTDSVSSLVQSDLAILRKSDAVLMDMSIPAHHYVGCVCELTYAFLWRIPTVVWVGDTGLELRAWLRYHATTIVRRRDDAVGALVALFG